MKKTLLAVSAALALTSSFTANAAENDQPQYLSDWWHQSVNVVGSYHTRFSPKLNNDVYLEYEAFAKKDWFDFYGYIDIPKPLIGVTATIKVSGPTVLRCSWKSNRVSRLIS